MSKILDLISREQQQYIVYLLIAMVVTIGTAVLYARSPLIYAPFFGQLNPTATMIFVSVLGAVVLTPLLARGWFAIFEAANLKGWAVAGGLAVAFGLVMIFFDSRVILPADVNRSYPDALLFYPTIGFVVEVVFHVLPLTLLLLLATFLFRSLSFEALVWPVILIVALLEPAFQTWAGYSRPYPAWVMAFVAVFLFAFSVTQLALFKRYDFVTMYAFRLLYYLLWHIVWGVARLNILF